MCFPIHEVQYIPMIVPAKALINLRSYVKSNKNYTQSLDELYFFRYAREALGFLVRQMAFEEPVDLYVPGYICDSTISECGGNVNIYFYDVPKDLKIDRDDIEACVSKSSNKNKKILLIVNYFGIVKYNETDFEALKVLFDHLILDSCHHNFSYLERKICPYLDAEIFSFRKNFPVIHGGALRINRGWLTPMGAVTSRFQTSQIFVFLIIRILEASVIKLNIFNIYSKFITALKYRFRNLIVTYRFSFGADLKRYNKSYDFIATNVTHRVNLLDRVRVGKSIDLIRRNFLAYSSFCDANGIEYLKAGSGVPQVFSVVVADLAVLELLRSKGIGCFAWPGHELPPGVKDNRDLLPSTHWLSNHLVHCPVHQSVTLDQVRFVCAALKEFINAEG